MTKTNWEIKLQTVKVHVRIRGNGLADTQTKDAAANENIKGSCKNSLKV